MRPPHNPQNPSPRQAPAAKGGIRGRQVRTPGVPQPGQPAQPGAQAPRVQPDAPAASGAFPAADPAVAGAAAAPGAVRPPRHPLPADPAPRQFDRGVAGGVPVDDAVAYGTEAEPEGSGGLPVRGLAMILLAAAVLLISWGAYSLLNKDSDSNNSETAAATSAPAPSGNADAPAPAPQPGQPGQPAQQGQPAPQNAPGEGQNPAPANPAAPASPAAPAPAAPGVPSVAPQQGQANPAPAPAPAAPINRANERVLVLNNSAVSGLAADVAGRVRATEFNLTSIGNLPGQAGVFPQSVVLYPKGDVARRAAAEDLARNLGIAARERTAATDNALAGARLVEGPGQAAIVVVTANDMPR